MVMIFQDYEVQYVVINQPIVHQTDQPTDHWRPFQHDHCLSAPVFIFFSISAFFCLFCSIPLITTHSHLFPSPNLCSIFLSFCLCSFSFNFFFAFFFHFSLIFNHIIRHLLHILIHIFDFDRATF